MKYFVIQTKSESSDHYTYFLQNETKPNKKELDVFLKNHANDKDDYDGELTVYEHIESVIEIPNFNKFLTIK